MVTKEKLVAPTILTGVVGGISSIVCGLIPNFCCAPCNCCLSGFNGCSAAGAMFVVALSIADELNKIAITDGCREKYGDVIGNITDGDYIYKETDGICYRFGTKFTDHLRWAYWIGIGFLSAFLICFALWFFLPESYSPRAAKKSKPSELKPLVSQQQIELSEIKF